jgi:hypothetical protein
MEENVITEGQMKADNINQIFVFRSNLTLFLVLGMEIVGGPWKTYVGIGIDLPWSLGYSILPGTTPNGLIVDQNFQIISERSGACCTFNSER